jgi:thiol:disulfide interchange protein DsbD
MPLAFLVESGLGDSLQHHPWLALTTLFGAGLATSVSPCVWPMIPITAGMITGPARAATSRRRVVGLTLTYVLGVALFYAVLGLAAGLTGSLFGTVAANPWVLFAMGNLLLVFGLAQLDVIPVVVPRRLAAWAGGLSGGSYPAVLLLGATSGVVAAPCGAPAFAAVLTWVATTGNGTLGMLYLFAFSIGMTAVLAAVGLFSGTLTALPKPGPWMTWIKRAAGGILLAMAEYYFVQVGKGL